MTNPIPSPESPKSEWRVWALAARRSLDLPALSDQLCATLEPALAGARHILLYAASPLELDVLPLTNLLPEAQFYLPRCAPERRLAIHGYPCPLVVSHFGIREPQESVPEVSPDILDLVLVPALVIDERGYRLGYGAGYYDRFLPKLPKTCRTMGIAPFLVPKLLADDWDIPVDAIFAPQMTAAKWV